MKKLFLILCMAAVAVAAYSQAAYQTFAADTVKGDTLNTVATAKAPYWGIVTFDFNVKTKSASQTVYIDFQGSNDSWVSVKTISTTTVTSPTLTNYQLLANPATYLEYRLKKRAAATTDTAIFLNKLFIFKR